MVDLAVDLEDGRIVPVRAPDHESALLVVGLLHVAVSRSCPLPDPVTGETVTVPMVPDTIRDLLVNYYCRPGGAKLVAQVLRILAGLRRGEDAPLRAVLALRPELWRLWRDVRAELARSGEQPWIST